jgi:SAM-dependent methyltransferase
MDNKKIEIQDGKINVEEIMAKIQENIRLRKDAGKLKHDPNSTITSASNSSIRDPSNDPIRRDLAYITSNWDIHNNSYFISSHHPYIGNFLVKGRQLIHGEVRRYVDPMISRQTEVNSNTVRIINHLTQKCAELEQKLKDLEDAWSRQKILDQKISQCIDMVNNGIEKKIDERIDTHLSLMNADIHERAWLAHILEDRIQMGLEKKSGFEIPSTELNYYLFEERFRGSSESIKQQQIAFLPFFENCSYVLDIGCGRGEFLEILRDHNIGGIGIDIDPDMVQYCRSRHLSVEQTDAITYLEKTEDNCLDGIFIDQVVEHLKPDYLVKTLAACYKKLRYGGYIVVETVNPLSLASFFNFYLDMSHHKPVHPLTLNFLLESVGFRDNEIKYYSKIPDEVKLQKIQVPEKISETEQKILSTFNRDIEQLNNLLWGPRDYAIIGKK